MASTDGAIISTVESSSPAEKAGMKAGDVLIGVNGKDVEMPRFTQQGRDDADWGNNKSHADKER